MKSGQCRSSADHPAAEAEWVCGAKHDSPRPEGAGSLSIRSCEAAGEQAVPAEVEYENSCVSNYDGVSCSSNLGRHTDCFRGISLQCGLTRQLVKTSFSRSEPLR